ncbi:lipoprotein yhcN precursor [Gracilibacillus boraciitolerans JCM 21714]|uniref:Lipoprotein yhcN n=1 Tax=Gracilibacillus boraciitolerans JCM 21714 TaxID=1298598 RepID=W4VIY6_9BACI|nr:YhcN/YlaJ family sporulation lipoprotein [Gracilibacillus boraciitolerans]GAE93365.1 lipoprotein yhcN precursor [Gracilibacillus boraciitolerans JCM 21714]
MKLSKPALALTFATSLTLVACGGNEYGQQDSEFNGNNTQPIGYNQTSNEPMTDRANNGNQAPSTNQYRDNKGDTRMNENNQFMFDGKTNRDANNMKNSSREGSNYEVADKAAEKIKSEVPEIDRAYVLTTDNNAYVAASWDKRTDKNSNKNNSELTDETKQKITKAVKSVNKDIDNVYISTNPDFFDLADEYTNDMDNGEPVQGFFRRLGNTIERVFPDEDNESLR